MTAADFEAGSCPRNQTLNEDNALKLHLAPPLRKHFVTGSCFTHRNSLQFPSVRQCLPFLLV
jgi:hypothetical protein